MTDTVEADISEALFKRVDQKDFSIQMPVAFPGIPFQVNGSPFLSVNNHFTRVDQIAYGEAGPNRYQGFLRVDVCWPKTSSEDYIGEGTLPALRVAAEVVSLFKRHTTILAGENDTRVVSINTPPQVTDPVETSDWIRVPVTVRWQSDNPNVT